MRASTKKVLAAASAVLIIVLLLMMPKQPASIREAASVSSDPLHSKVDSAIALVQGDNPMQGIMLLREVLEEDSTNVAAHYWLGMFSIQSQQLDKAQERFETVVSINPDFVDAYWQMAHLSLEKGEFYQAIDHFNKVLELAPEEYSSAHFFLGKTYATIGETGKAIASFRTYKGVVKDTVVSKRVDDFIDELENNLNN